MKISIVVAVSENGVIGSKGKIPWYIPEDLKHFKAVTMGHHILMGRKTYESIGRALPGRTSIILTKNKKFKVPDCFIFQDIRNAIEFAKSRKEKELFVIGGEKVYKAMLPFVNTIYLTRVYKKIDGDVFFPKINIKEWKKMSTEKHPEIDPPIEFETLNRLK